MGAIIIPHFTDKETKAQRVFAGRQDNAPPHLKMSGLFSGTCVHVTLHSNGTSDMIKAMDLEMQRLSWIVQVGPV